MDRLRKSCCVRALGWSFVGIAIAVAWGIGNLTGGMSPLDAFAVPAVIVAIIVGVIALALFNVSWFARLCVCEERSGSGESSQTPGRERAPTLHGRG